MLKLQFARAQEESVKILCLGAHSDDIEMGCGGSIIKLLEVYPKSEVYWIVFSSTKDRANEAQKSAELFLKEAGHRTIIIKNFRDSFFPYIGDAIKEYFEEIKKLVLPDIIFTHFRYDLHQDHRLISELSWNTFRDHMILEYEIIKYDGDLGVPNLFIHINKEIARKKIKNIIEVFKSQNNRSWFTEDVFYSIMRIRGIESNAPDKYAEAFYCRKMIF